MDKPDLSIWAELFAGHRSLSFVGANSPVIIYRLRRDEDPTSVAAEIMTEYVRILDSIE
jgi:hypothetical protein